MYKTQSFSPNNPLIIFRWPQRTTASRRASSASASKSVRSTSREAETSSSSARPPSPPSTGSPTRRASRAWGRSRRWSRRAGVAGIRDRVRAWGCRTHSDSLFYCGLPMIAMRHCLWYLTVQKFIQRFSYQYFKCMYTVVCHMIELTTDRKLPEKNTIRRIT